MDLGLCIAARFGLGGRDIFDGFEQTTGVEPVDPFEGGEFDGLERPPRAASMDHLGLEQAVARLSQRVVVAVTDAADGGLDARLGVALGIADRQVLRAPVARAIALPNLRLAFFDNDGTLAPTPEIAAAVRAAADALANLGVMVEERRPPEADRAATIYYDMTRGDGGSGVRAFLKSVGTERISPLFEQSLTSRSAPAMANTTEALAAFTRWDAYRNTCWAS